MVLNTQKMVAGIFMIMLAYILMLILDPTMAQISTMAQSLGFDVAFIDTMGALGDWFCILIGAAGLVFIVTAPLARDTSIYEK